MKFKILLILLTLMFNMSLFALEKHSIIVDTKHCKMIYTSDGVVSEYTVATVKEGLPFPKGIGYITKVDLEPSWYPTQRTKDYFKEHKGIILPNVVPYNSQYNYMGAFKITMTNTTPSRGAVYRIHGNIDDSKIGTRASGGCVRMHNEEGLLFAKEIKKLLNNNERISVQYV